MAYKFRNKWRVEWRDSKGKRRSKTFRNKLQATNFELTLKSDPSLGNECDLTFEQFSEVWKEKYCKVEKLPSSQKEDEIALRAHIIPSIGHIKMVNLSKSS